MKNEFKGAGVALVTPFMEDMSIDYPALKRLLDHVVVGGIDYLVVCGTTGESVTLSKDEKKSLLQFVIENNKTKLPVVFGIGGNNTNECLHEIEETNFQHVNAILSVGPYYNKPSQSGIIAHYEIIADHSPVPVILYNVPGRTSSNITWQSTSKLAKHENIIGIKEASGNLEQCMRIRNNTPKDFILISGDDLLTGPIMSVGAVGVISVLGNAFPSVFHDMIKAAKDGDYQAVRKETSKILEINPLMYSEGNPVGIKEVLNQKGICTGVVRLPHLPASDELKTAIKAVLNGF